MKQKKSFAIEKISQHLEERKETPLFGNGSFFPEEELSSLLAQEFGMEEFSVRLKARKWEEAEEIQKQIKSSKFVGVKLSPLETPLFWVMTKADRDQFTASMLSDRPKKKAFSTQSLQEGYYQFLLLQALHALQQLDPIRQMTLQIEDTEEIPKESGICMDIEISFRSCTAWGKLILLESFRKDWVQHFAAFPPQYVPSELSKKLPIDLGIRIGSVNLPYKEWEKLQPGDLLIPDEIAYRETSYPAILSFKQTPLFHARVDEEFIEITHFAFNTEELMQESKHSEEETLSSKLNFAEKESKAIQEIPIQIHVEIAQVQMTLNDLMNLSPGNTLSLPAHSDKKMILTYRGEKVGVAELVYLGETLGLKILEI